MKKTIVQFGIVGVLAVPFITFAQQGKTLLNIIQTLIGYFNAAIILIIGLAVVTFVWNVYKYFFKSDSDKKEAGLYVMYSVIGFFVILSFWGLVFIISNSLNLPKGQPAWPFGIGGGINSGTSYPTGGFNSGSLPTAGNNVGSYPTGGNNSGGYPTGGNTFNAGLRYDLRE